MATLIRPPIAPTAAPGIHRRGPIAFSAIPRRAAPAARGAVIASCGNARRRWWAPLFRLILLDEAPSEEQQEAATEGAAAKEEEATVRRARLTAEKARVLRREMRATEIWHDAMYHSAIASRLASADQP